MLGWILAISVAYLFIGIGISAHFLAYLADTQALDIARQTDSNEPPRLIVGVELASAILWGPILILVLVEVSLEGYGRLLKNNNPTKR